MSTCTAFTGPFYVVNSESGEAVQSERTKELAERATMTLNEHAQRRGGTEVYIVVEEHRS